MSDKTVAGARETLRAATNYAFSLMSLKRFEEAKPLLRKVVPVARRILTDSNEITLKMRWTWAIALHDSVGGSFAARWARMVLKRCSSERGEREKRFYGGGKGERRRTAF